MGVAAAERLCLAILTLPAEAVHRLLVELTIRPPCPSPDPREVLGSRQPAKVPSPPHPTWPAPHGAVRQQLPWELLPHPAGPLFLPYNDPWSPPDVVGQQCVGPWGHSRLPRTCLAQRLGMLALEDKGHLMRTPRHKTASHLSRCLLLCLTSAGHSCNLQPWEGASGPGNSDNVPKPHFPLWPRPSVSPFL